MIVYVLEHTKQTTREVQYLRSFDPKDGLKTYTPKLNNAHFFSDLVSVVSWDLVRDHRIIPLTIQMLE